jgi:hypothetical protein
MNEELKEIAARNNCTISSIKAEARKIAREKNVNEVFVAFDILRYCRNNGKSVARSKEKSKPKI